MALLRGQVVPLGAPVTRGALATSLYASIPVVFPDALATFSESTPATVCVWLFPLHPEEAEYISSRGWNSFENILERVDPDLYDLNRESAVNRR